jgi:hypothetical protein
MLFGKMAVLSHQGWGVKHLPKFFKKKGRTEMKLKTTLLILGIFIGSSPALAAGLGQGCDTRSGRDGGQ